MSRALLQQSRSIVSAASTSPSYARVLDATRSEWSVARRTPWSWPLLANSSKPPGRPQHQSSKRHPKVVCTGSLLQYAAVRSGPPSALAEKQRLSRKRDLCLPARSASCRHETLNIRKRKTQRLCLVSGLCLGRKPGEKRRTFHRHRCKSHMSFAAAAGSVLPCKVKTPAARVSFTKTASALVKM